MGEFEKLTSSIDFNQPYDLQAHRDIYGAICLLQSRNGVININHHLPTDRIDASSASAPPSLIFYAARNILSPAFIIGQIPDLLNLLAVIETYRRHAVIKADDALEWQKYYAHEKSCGRAGEVRLLTAGEVRTLKGFMNKKDAQRREYIVLVRNLIQLHVHYLWTAPESCLLWKRLNDFFPGSIVGFQKPSKLLFHVGLSRDEQIYFRQLQVDCQRWVQLVEMWNCKREETCAEEGISREDMTTSFADDFLDAFPQPFKPSEMAQNVEIYVHKVENMVQKLQEWFPTSSES